MLAIAGYMMDLSVDITAPHHVLLTVLTKMLLKQLIKLCFLINNEFKCYYGTIMK